MGHATVRSFTDLGAIFNDAANAPKKEMEAANENRGTATNNGAKPVALCADDAGHNVLYVLGFGLLGAVVGLAVVAFIVGHGSAAMPLSRDSLFAQQIAIS